jgi:hypothetical protein
MDILPAAQRRLWPELGEFTDTFVLYDGTAIALRLGHRSSVDFDFFSSSPLDADEILKTSSSLRDCEVLQLEPNSLTVSILRGDPVKVSFFGDITFGRVGHPDLSVDGVMKVASLQDLLGTKLKVLLQRIEVKDYLDIEAILRSGIRLDVGLGAARALYGRAFPPMECVKALGYFEEASARQVPEETKRYLRQVIAEWEGGVSEQPLIADTLG